MPRPPSRWRLAARRYAGLALAVALGAAAASAQTSCRRGLPAAEAAYRAGAYAAANAALEPCFDGPDARVPVAAFRLRALTLLRQQELDEAQEILIRMLAAHPGYTPDPVMDPPVYVALVTMTAQQVRPRRAPRTPLAALPAAPLHQPPPRVREATAKVILWPEAETPVADRRGLWLGAAVHTESYSGERQRVNAPLAGLSGNTGLGGAVTLGLPVGRWWTVEAHGGAFRLPRLIRDGLADAESGYPLEPGQSLGEPASTYRTLTPETTSRWVASAAVGLRADAAPASAVRPYVAARGRGLARQIAGDTRVSLSPELALGLDVGRRVAGTLEASGTLVVADAALDDAVFRRNGDLLVGLRAGIRLRF